MAITIPLSDDLIAELNERAKKQQLTVEQLAIQILTEAVAGFELVTPREVVSRIRSTPPNPTQVRTSTANLADLLDAAPGHPFFDLESWKRQWSVEEAEMKAITRANDLAEGRERLD